MRAVGRERGMVAAAELPGSDPAVSRAVDPGRVESRGDGRLAQPRVSARVDDGAPVGRDRGGHQIARPVRALEDGALRPLGQVEQFE